MRDGASEPVSAAPTRAMILAAGLGTRLRPLTDRVPKCMIRVGGRPLLEHTLEWLRSYGIADVVINLHHLSDAVRGHFGDGTAHGVRIVYSHETELLGTAGAVKRVAAFFNNEPFYVWYGDNLSTCRLERLWDLHHKRGSVATMALFHRERDATQSGIADLDDDGRIRRFVEKPAPTEVFSHWVNAGILVLEPRVLESVPATGFVDFGRDIFPKLLARGAPVYGYRMSSDESLWWIDRPEDLARLERAWPADRQRPGDPGPRGG